MNIEKFLDSLTTKRTILIICIVGFLVYSNSFFNNFVWDDKAFIILNPAVHSINIPLQFGKSIFNDGVYYRPLQALYAAVLYSVFSTSVFPYHLLQLLIHLAGTIFLYLIFKRFFDKTYALILSLVFLVHPMQVESASYIAQTASPLFFIFGILALFLTIKGRVKFSFPLIGFLLLLSLLVKESGILFVVLLIFYSFLYKIEERFRILTESTGAIFFYLVLRFWVGQPFFDKSLLYNPIARVTFIQRLFTVPEVAFYYLKTFVFPINLSINQHWVVTSPNFGSFYLPLLVDLLVLGIIILGGIYFSKKSREIFYSYIFFSVWFVLGISFHLQLVPLDMTVADRWFYFSIAGLLGTIGVFLSRSQFGSIIRKIIVPILLVIIVGFGIRTVIRNMDWKDSKTLYKHDIKISDNFELENNMGSELIQDGDYKSAIPYLRRSVQMWPDWDRGWDNLGVAYQLSGNISGAKESYEKAISINPNHVQIIERLSALLVFYYDPEDAKELIITALFKFRQRSMLWYYLSLADYKLGHNKVALQDITNAYQLDPGNNDIKTVLYLLQNNQPIIFKND